MGLTITTSADVGHDNDPSLPGRDYHGRPKVWLPDGSKRVPYARTSGAGEALEDKRGLMNWKSRLAAYGAFKYPDILSGMASVTNLDDTEQKRQADRVTEALQEAAGMSIKAMAGTHIHTLSEAVDAGYDVGFMPDSVARVVDNYRRLVELAKQEFGYQPYLTEQFVVNDTYGVAGTADRYSFVHGLLSVVDIKTWGSSEYAAGKTAMQLLGYAGGVCYNDLQARQGFNNGLGVGRSPIHPEHEVSQEIGWVIWVPQHGSGGYMGSLDLTKAHDGYRLASELKEWQNGWKRKANKFTPSLTVE